MAFMTSLTCTPNNLDPRAIIDAIARRDCARMIVDGITAANDIGSSGAVPAHIIVDTDARLKSLALGNLVIRFKMAARWCPWTWCSLGVAPCFPASVRAGHVSGTAESMMMGLSLTGARVSRVI